MLGISKTTGLNEIEGLSNWLNELKVTNWDQKWHSHEVISGHVVVQATTMPILSKIAVLIDILPRYSRMKLARSSAVPNGALLEVVETLRKVNIHTAIISWGITWDTFINAWVDRDNISRLNLMKINDAVVDVNGLHHKRTFRLQILQVSIFWPPHPSTKEPSGCSNRHPLNCRSFEMSESIDVVTVPDILSRWS